MALSPTHIRPGRRSLAALALSVVASMGLAACGSSGSDSDSIELVFATGEAETSPNAVSAKWFMDEVTERTDGKVTWKSHYAGSLLPSTEIAAGVKDGRIDAGILTSPYDPANFPLYNVGYVPFSESNTVGAARALRRMYEENDAIRAEAERNNAHFLIHVGSTNASTVATKTPITTLDDFDGLKVRVIGSLAKGLAIGGANPIAIPVEETFEALERGVIDGIAGSNIASLVTYSLPQTAPQTYFLPTGHYSGSIGMMLSKQQWDSLPDDVRTVMEEVQDEHYETMPEVSMKREAESCDAVIKMGGDVDWFPAEQAERDAWVKDIGNAMFDDWHQGAVKAGASEADVTSVEEDFKRLAAEEAAAASDYTPGEELCIAKSQGN